MQQIRKPNSHDDWLELLSELYGKSLTPVMAVLYREGLRDIPFPELDAACQRAVRELKFFPTVAELRQFAGADAESHRKALEAGDDLAAEHEWMQVVDYKGKRACCCHGDMDVRFSDAGKYALRLVGGWRAICEARDLEWKHKEFTAGYKRYSATDGLKALPKSEAERLLNRAKGLLPEGIN